MKRVWMIAAVSRAVCVWAHASDETRRTTSAGRSNASSHRSTSGAWRQDHCDQPRASGPAACDRVSGDHSSSGEGRRRLQHSGQLGRTQRSVGSTKAAARRCSQTSRSDHAKARDYWTHHLSTDVDEDFTALLRMWTVSSAVQHLCNRHPF